MMNSRRDKIAIYFCWWLMRTLTSKGYRTRLNTLIYLGEIKMKELSAAREARETALANSPGWDPVSEKIINPMPEITPREGS